MWLTYVMQADTESEVESLLFYGTAMFSFEEHNEDFVPCVCAQQHLTRNGLDVFVYS
jgi:hypothetical protein